MLKKPANIANDAFCSSKWDELCEGRDFAPVDAPLLALLCRWYAVIERCAADISGEGELPTVSYVNDMGDIKAMPQLATMKQASAEIRQLNKQLGICDQHEESEAHEQANILSIVSAKREARRAGTA